LVPGATTIVRSDDGLRQLAMRSPEGQRRADRLAAEAQCC
jgi:hypothetical protein